MAEEEGNDDFQAATWESLNPLSFVSTVYIRSLKMSVTAGSFVTYCKNRSVGQRDVCRIIDIVTSIDLVPEYARQSLLSQEEEDNENEFPVQFAKVNLFVDIKTYNGCCGIHFPEAHQDSKQHYQQEGSWNRIVQLNRIEWILSSWIVGLAFIAFESDDAMDDYCFRGMSNLFLAKYRIMEDKGGSEKVSIIPHNEWPPFAGHIKGFQDVWSVDNCLLIFNNIRHIRVEMQRILCRIAQSQGDFTTRSAKMQLPSSSWYFIKQVMASGGVQSIKNINFCSPHAYLTWGLVLNSRRNTGHQEVLRFDTERKLDVFRSLFGTMSGYGVRKRRPKYGDAPSPLVVNDIVNAVCPAASSGSPGEDQTASVFKRFGVMKDGIDFMYGLTDGTLQIILRYQKVVVSNETVPILACVGVGESGARGGIQSSTNQEQIANIVPGMEFIDGTFVMRVHEVKRSGQIHAIKAFKILPTGSAIKVVNPFEVVVYSNVENVHNKILAMLE
jgi:hypothetical protein